jgi:hypothetical protein
VIWDQAGQVERGEDAYGISNMMEATISDFSSAIYTAANLFSTGIVLSGILV